MKVFILDDDLGRMTLFRDALFGHTLTTAMTHNEARVAFNPPYDLILLDHDIAESKDQRPYPTGLSFLKCLSEKQLFRMKGSRIIIHSWNPDGAASMYHYLENHNLDAEMRSFGVTLLKHLKELK